MKTTTTIHQPIAQWRCCLCAHSEHNTITRDVRQPAVAHTTTAAATVLPPFDTARCALCSQPPCGACLVSRPAPRWDAASRTYASPSCLLEWNPAPRDAWGFVCMHCGTPKLVSRARRLAHAAARNVFAQWGGSGDGEMEFLPFERRRKRCVGEMLGLFARCGNEACGQPMCDESLEFYVPVDGQGGEEVVGRWEMADWICSAAEGTARWVSAANLKGVAKGALGFGLMYYFLPKWL